VYLLRFIYGFLERDFAVVRQFLSASTPSDGFSGFIPKANDRFFTISISPGTIPLPGRSCQSLFVR